MLFRKNKKKGKVVFFGTSDFAAEILETLVKEHEITAVITQPDKPVGRKHEIEQNPVSKLASQLNIPIQKPEKLKNDKELLKYLEQQNADFFVVIAYGKIIPEEILALPKFGAINIHPSLLPKYRGPSPIHAAILNRDRKTGVSIMLMDKQMDHGPIIAQKSLFIKVYEFYPRLEYRLCSLSKKMISKVLAKILSERKIRSKSQDDQKATYCKFISKEDGRINWSKDCEDVFSQFRAFFIWPGIWTTFKGKKLIIKNCVPLYDIFDKDDGKNPGIVGEKEGKIYVACGKNKLQILELQLEGKNNVSVRNFINGYKDFLGAKLGE